MIITYNNLFFSGSILTKQYFKVHVMVGVSFEFLNYCAFVHHVNLYFSLWFLHFSFCGARKPQACPSGELVGQLGKRAGTLTGFSPTRFQLAKGVRRMLWIQSTLWIHL